MQTLRFPCAFCYFLQHLPQVTYFVLILLHQLNDIQGELVILHSNGSPGFSTQDVVLGMAKAWTATTWEKFQGLDQHYM